MSEELEFRLCTRCNKNAYCAHWRFSFNPMHDFYLCKLCEINIRNIIKIYDDLKMIEIEKELTR